mmetsp:Transcript_28869/g.49583  ORF Transcript_28869/g.49583 Transcript_28869/m.49583 type:complete len:307 (-) Transcript_28869:438-1358(-)
MSFGALLVRFPPFFCYLQSLHALLHAAAGLLQRLGHVDPRSGEILQHIGAGQRGHQAQQEIEELQQLAVASHQKDLVRQAETTRLGCLFAARIESTGPSTGGCGGDVRGGSSQWFVVNMQHRLALQGTSEVQQRGQGQRLLAQLVVTAVIVAVVARGAAAVTARVARETQAGSLLAESAQSRAGGVHHLLRGCSWLHIIHLERSDLLHRTVPQNLACFKVVANDQNASFGHEHHALVFEHGMPQVALSPVVSLMDAPQQILAHVLITRIHAQGLVGAAEETWRAHSLQTQLLVCQEAWLEEERHVI